VSHLKKKVAIKQKAINAFFGWFPILPQKTQDARAENVQERVKLGSILIMAAEPVGGGCRVRRDGARISPRPNRPGN
jgi:hypothetical protein